MLKMYQPHRHAGSSPELWEENWASQPDFDVALSFCQVDPLRPLFEDYAKPGTLMLEGGCGAGQYVAYYTARGTRVVGLDFARDTLARLRAAYPHLILCEGDVAALPFRDGSFDLYYSGGVVEHFEAGALPALREARRVMRPGGVLLISVPYLSPLRRILTPFKQRLWKRVRKAEVDRNDQGQDLQFFQYIFSPREFEALLAEAGLRVIKKQGYAILWGLYELPFMEHIGRSLETRQANDQRPTLAEGSVPQLNRGGSNRPSLLKRLVVSEDDSIPLFGIAVRTLRWACANMMMYVCVPE